MSRNKNVTAPLYANADFNKLLKIVCVYVCVYVSVYICVCVYVSAYVKYI